MPRGKKGKDWSQVDYRTLNWCDANNVSRYYAKRGQRVGFIYCYTNKINGKQYIGQTLTPFLRHHQHLKCALNPITPREYNLVFHKAIRKYGIDNFEYAILDQLIMNKCDIDLLKSQLNEYEKKRIQEHHSYFREHGYNMTLGGESVGYNDTHPNSKPVVQYDMDGNLMREFGSIAEASRVLNCSEAVISCVCKHKNASVMGKYIFTFKDEAFIPLVKKVCGKKVYQYNLDGQFLKEYPSLSVAMQETGVSITSISYAIGKKSTTHQAGGYLWYTEKNSAICPLNNKKIYQYDLDGNFIREWNTKTEAYQFLGLKSAMSIYDSLQDPSSIVSGKYYFRNYQTDKLTDIINKSSKELYPRSHTVYAYDSKGQFVAEYDTLIQAARSIGYVTTACITQCLKMPWVSKKGIFWRTTKSNHIIIPNAPTPPDTLGQFDASTHQLIRTYKNVVAAASELNIAPSNIYACLHRQQQTANGFIWKRINNA